MSEDVEASRKECMRSRRSVVVGGDRSGRERTA